MDWIASRLGKRSAQLMDIGVSESEGKANQVSIRLGRGIPKVLGEVKCGHRANEWEHLYRTDGISEYALLHPNKARPAYGRRHAKNSVYFLTVAKRRKGGRPALRSAIADLLGGFPVAET